MKLAARPPFRAQVHGFDGSLHDWIDLSGVLTGPGAGRPVMASPTWSGPPMAAGWPSALIQGIGIPGAPACPAKPASGSSAMPVATWR